MTQGYTRNFTQYNPSTDNDVLSYREATTLTEIVRQFVQQRSVLSQDIDNITSQLIAHISRYDNPHNLNSDFIRELYWECLYWMYNKTLSTDGFPVDDTTFRRTLSDNPDIQVEIIRMWQMLRIGRVVNSDNLLRNTSILSEPPVTPLYIYRKGLPGLFYPYAGTLNSSNIIFNGNLSNILKMNEESGSSNIGYGIVPPKNCKILSVYSKTVANTGFMNAWVVSLGNYACILVNQASNGVGISGTASIASFAQSTIAGSGQETRPSFTNSAGFLTLCMTIDTTTAVATLYYQTSDTTWSQLTTTLPAITDGSAMNLVFTFTPFSGNMTTISTMDPSFSGFPSQSNVALLDEYRAPIQEEVVVFEGYPTNEFLQNKMLTA